jgi:hypothetical protein
MRIGADSLWQDLAARRDRTSVTYRSAGLSGLPERC